MFPIKLGYYTALFQAVLPFIERKKIKKKKKTKTPKNPKQNQPTNQTTGNHSNWKAFFKLCNYELIL